MSNKLHVMACVFTYLAHLSSEHFGDVINYGMRGGMRERETFLVDSYAVTFIM